MTISSMYNVDAGLKWISPNGKAEISLKVDDMFNSWVPKDLNLQYKTQDLHMRMIRIPDESPYPLSINSEILKLKSIKRWIVPDSGNKSRWSILRFQPIFRRGDIKLPLKGSTKMRLMFITDQAGNFPY